MIACLVCHSFLSLLTVVVCVSLFNAAKNFDALQPLFKGTPRVSREQSAPWSEAVQPVWMSGFHRALSLRDQQLSCQFCFRSVDPPNSLPRISMLRHREEREKAIGPAPV